MTELAHSIQHALFGVVLIATLFALSFASCDSNGPETIAPADTSMWVDFGPSDLDIREFRVLNGRVYADGSARGLYRLDLNVAPAAWESLGLDSTVSKGQLVGISDVAETSRAVIVAYRSDDWTDASMFRSLDDGATWIRADSSFSRSDGEFRRTRILTTHTRSVLADAVYETTDHGRTWNRAPMDHGPDGSIRAVEVPSSNPDVVWVGAQSVYGWISVSRSEDAGKTWTYHGDAIESVVRATAARAIGVDSDAEFALINPGSFSRSDLRRGGHVGRRYGGRTPREPVLAVHPHCGQGT